ncbi:putrescine transport system substrate-binding protein [Limimonas halophila]|uniref:Putrescine-binding periplasmic protein n=1 Tax=Limimonas halophila TaxID=1082479 RepID=A0A1G7S8E0_9PROT|nr:polyamine ABC transporter substrate-binding protein [Limimonas halophila]SDG19268.1 putrescine transport system substrate-binding protein [Limimonas halophila]
MSNAIRNAALGAIASLAGLSLTAAPAAQAAEDTLNIYNWSDYIHEDTVPMFEEEFGIDVNYDVYSSNEALEGKLMAGGSGYDVVVPSGSFFRRQIEAGIYQKLDKSKLDNWEHLDQQILERVENFDPDNQYGVPYMWGTTGIGYNPEMVDKHIDGEAPTNSWELLFNPKYTKQLQDCGIAMLDAPTEVLEHVRNYLGLGQNSSDPEDLEKAVAQLEKVRPHVKYFHSSQYINDLANGDICVAMGWSGDVYIARDRAAASEKDITIDYTIPEEGTLIWFDIMAIPKDAPHPDAAHKWLNFNMRPKIAAQNVNYVWYPTANADALEYIKPTIKNNPSIYPPKDVKANLYVDEKRPPEFARKETRAWQKVKTGF